MQRPALLPIVLAAALAVLPACAGRRPVHQVRHGDDSSFQAPPFAGRAVYSGGDGITRPVVDVIFFRGIGEEFPLDDTHRLAQAADASGRFSIPGGIRTATTGLLLDGRIVRTEEYVEDVVFVLRAPGCDDRLVHYTKGWREQDVVLTCPGRSSPGENR